MAAIKKNGVVVKRLPGMTDSNFFSVHPNGSSAYFFDTAEDSHVKINLANGQRSSIKTKDFNSIEAIGFICDQITVVRTPRYFSCILFEEATTNMLFVVTYSFRNGRTSIVDEHYIYINGTCNTREQFVQGDKGEIICLSSTWNGRQTIFNAAQISVDDTGAIQSNVIASNRVLNGRWDVPFIYNSNWYWLSLNPTAYLKRLLRVSLIYDKNDRWLKGEKIDMRIECDDFSGFQSASFTQAKLIGGLVFYFTYVEDKEQYMLFYIDLMEKSLEKISFSMDSHFINSAISMEVSRADTLYLNGNCCLSTCRDKAHFYVIDIKNILQKLLYQETVTTVQHHNPKEKRIECSVCFEQYDAAAKCPKMLPCGHTLCTVCVETLIKAQRSNIICPTCRCHHIILSISAVPKNFELINVLDRLAINSVEYDEAIRCSECSEPISTLKSKLRYCMTCRMENFVPNLPYLCAECCLNKHKNHQLIQL